jgi:hypothetical protein
MMEAALGDELAEPHDHGSAGRHDDDHDDDEQGILVGNQLLVAAAEELPGRAGERQDRRRLQDGQADGEVAGVLRDLGLPRLAFLLQRLQARDDHREQLENDARRDVGHDAQRKYGELQQRATAEEVDDGVDRVVRGLVDASLNGGVVHTGRRDDRAQAEDRQHGQREEQLLAQVRGTERRDEGAEVHAYLLGDACAPPCVVD